jgi:magnesium transporter
LRLSHKRIAKSGTDYLFLSFLDAIVDEYMATVDAIREPIEDLELTMVKRPNISVMPRIMEFKSRLNAIRRFTAPLREELQRIRTENPDLIKKHNQVFFRDIQDHINTLIVNFENFREMLRDLADLHNSNQNLTLNNTMKTLTSISAVFIPLTFIVGVYGMNFKYFPELEWRYGYLWIWLVMIAISGGLIAYMKKKRWF